MPFENVGMIYQLCQDAIHFRIIVSKLITKTLLIYIMKSNFQLIHEKQWKLLINFIVKIIIQNEQDLIVEKLGWVGIVWEFGMGMKLQIFIKIN